MWVSRLKYKELKVFLILFSMFFSITSVIITGSTVRDSVFLLNFDRTYLPLMYVLIAILVPFIIRLHRHISDGLDELKVANLMGLVFTLSLVLFNYEVLDWLIPFFYIWMEIIIIFSVIQFWILAGRILNPRQAKRIFPLIISGGSLAVIASGYCIKPFTQKFGSDSLLFLTLIFLGLSILISQFLHQFVKKDLTLKSDQINSKSKQKPVFDNYLKSIAIMVICSAFVTKIIDYQFKIYAVNTFPDQNELVNFFGSYYMYTGAATLFMQAVFSPFILTRYGILTGLIILPAAISIGSVGFAALGSLSAILFSKFSDQVFKFSIYNAVKEILWLPLPNEKRNFLKPSIDGTAKSVAEGLAGFLIFILIALGFVPESRIYILSIPVLLIAIYWIWNLFNINTGYVTEIIKSIENRQLNLDEVKFDFQEVNTLNTLEEALDSGNEFKQIFALDLISKMPLSPWHEKIVSLFEKGTYPVKREIIKLSQGNEDIISNELLVRELKNVSVITPELITCCVRRNIPGVKSIIEAHLESSDSSILASAAIGYAKINSDKNKAKKIIDQILSSGDENQIAKLIKYAKTSANIFSTSEINSFLKSGTYEIQNESLKIIALDPKIDHLDHVINFLGDPMLKRNAERTLLSYPQLISQKKLIDKLTSEDTSTTVVIGILKILHHFNKEIAIKTIISKMNDPDLAILGECSDALIKIYKSRQITDEEIRKIESLIQELSKRSYHLHYFSNEIANDYDGILINDHIKNDLKFLSRIIIKLGTLENSDVPLETYIRYVESRDPNMVPLVIELIDSTFSKENKKLVIPLIDPEANPVKNAKDIYGSDILSSETMLLSWLKSPHKWKTNISLQYIIQKNNFSLLKDLKNEASIENHIDFDFFSVSEKKHISKYFLNLKNIHEESSKMYSVLEKTIQLKSVNLFKNIPGNVLSKIAQLTSEIQCYKNYKIFQEGDFGDSMFIILSGKISITNEGQSIAMLEKGQCIGEMSLLDQQPRSAGAIAMEDSVLLKIDQESFYELMASKPEIMREIMKILTQRVRDINKKFTESRQSSG